MIQLPREWVGPTSAIQPPLLESVAQRPWYYESAGGASTFTTPATVEELSEDASDGRNGDVASRATTALERNPLAAGTKLGGRTGGSRGGSGGGGGGPGGGGAEGTMAQDPVKEEGQGKPLVASGLALRQTT